MSKFHNLARMTTTTTGTGTISLVTSATGFLTFAAAGVQDGETVTYAIEEGNNREVGRGIYTASGATLTRNVLISTAGGTAPITLAGNAQVFITVAAEDMNALVGTPVGVPSTPAAGAVQLFALYNAVPAMTSNTAPSGYTASASSNYTTTPPWGAFQTKLLGAYGGDGVGWITNSTVAGWLQMQLPSAVVISAYELMPLPQFPNRSPKDFTLQGSNNGSTWITLDTQTGQTTDWWVTGPTAKVTESLPRTFYLLANTTAYSYYRLNITANCGDSYTSVSQFKLMTATPNNFAPPSMYVRDANGLCAKIALINPASSWM